MEFNLSNPFLLQQTSTSSKGKRDAMLHFILTGKFVDKFRDLSRYGFDTIWGSKKFKIEALCYSKGMNLEWTWPLPNA